MTTIPCDSARSSEMYHAYENLYISPTHSFLTDMATHNHICSNTMEMTLTCDRCKCMVLEIVGWLASWASWLYVIIVFVCTVYMCVLALLFFFR